MEVIRMKKIYSDAGARIRKLREDKKYTRECLSELAEISPKFLYEIENGQKGFSADTLYRLAQALDTNADYILYGEYRGKTDDKVIQLLNRFDSTGKAAVIAVIELMYKVWKNSNY